VTGEPRDGRRNGTSKLQLGHARGHVMTNQLLGDHAACDDGRPCQQVWHEQSAGRS